MDYKKRCNAYRQIEKIRGRPLISYVTSSRANDGGGRMGLDVIPEFCNQLLKIPDEEKNIDIFIETYRVYWKESIVNSYGR